MNFPADQNRGIQSLTYREKEVLRLRVKGYSSKKIAAVLTIEITTVRTHLKHIHSKLGVSSQTKLIQFVHKMHI
ncbi:ATP-dependent transcriptional regulator [Desulfitobacterium sp. LBE]|uniref:response regulator transcription factor n=1 Tax=Desulfitobacterium sp. LBE TaxID=884086 RepID=UPI001199DD6D|nr:LuxR C-terminal-related transcriptional regulator [Desulfitobacterium sp. LBE]TWH60696.1 ATP-dependent transcriptional regulator [Desulfitobacterium sp. LBE]